MSKLNFVVSVFLIVSSFFALLPLSAFDGSSSAFSVSNESKDLNTITETRKVNEVLDEIEKHWNAHNIEKVIEFYDDRFVNGDGLNIDAVKELTKDLWEAYPDIMSKAIEKTVRIQGDYATIESTDVFEGSSSMIRPEVGTKGNLRATSAGQMFFKKFGTAWKVTSDKTLVEKVSIGYGIGAELLDQNKIQITAPEQVISGQQYTARLTFNLSDDIKPVAAISKELLIYPQVSVGDKFRLIGEKFIERLINANRISRNELVTATVGLTGGALKPKLLGLVFLSRRVNVVPVSGDNSEISIIKEPAKSSLNTDVDLLDKYPDKQLRELKEQNEPEENKKEPEFDSD